MLRKLFGVAPQQRRLLLVDHMCSVRVTMPVIGHNLRMCWLR